MEAAGRLSLEISRREGGKSYASAQFHEGALRILRPHYLDDSGRPTFIILNPGGAYLGGDHYEIAVQVRSGAQVELRTQSAGKVYRTPQGPATQHMQVYLESGAQALYVPEQLILYQAGEYHQTTEVLMAADATFLTAEILTPGWAPDGRAFSFAGLRQKLSISVLTEHGPQLNMRDHLRIFPAEEVTGLGFMDGFTHLGQLIIASPLVDAQLKEMIHGQLKKYPALKAAVTVAGKDSRCLVLRSLGQETQAIADLHAEIITRFLQR